MWSKLRGISHSLSQKGPLFGTGDRYPSLFPKALDNYLLFCCMVLIFRKFSDPQKPSFFLLRKLSTWTDSQHSRPRLLFCRIPDTGWQNSGDSRSRSICSHCHELSFSEHVCHCDQKNLLPGMTAPPEAQKHETQYVSIETRSIT